MQSSRLWLSLGRASAPWCLPQMILLVSHRADRYISAAESSACYAAETQVEDYISLSDVSFTLILQCYGTLAETFLRKHQCNGQLLCQWNYKYIKMGCFQSELTATWTGNCAPEQTSYVLSIHPLSWSMSKGKQRELNIPQFLWPSSFFQLLWIALWVSLEYPSSQLCWEIIQQEVAKRSSYWDGHDYHNRSFVMQRSSATPASCRQTLSLLLVSVVSFLQATT